MKKILLPGILVLGMALIVGQPLSAQTLYTQVVTNDHPILYWNFDEPSGNAVEVMPVIPPSNIDDLIPQEGVTWVSHAAIGDGFNLGNAGSFSLGTYGTCFTANVLYGTSNSIPGPWMLEFWMQVQGSQQYQRDNYVMNFGNNAPAVLYDYIGAAQSRDGIELYSAKGRTGLGPVITDTNFHYILFAYYGDGSNGVTDRLDVYVDGTNAAQSVRGTFSSSLALNSSLVVGDASIGDAGDAFQGNLDEVATYNLAGIATNASQVTSIASTTASNHYAAALAAYPAYAESVLASNPVLYWNFDVTNAPSPELAPIVLHPLTNDLVAVNGAGRVSHASLGDGLKLGNAATFVKTSGQYYDLSQVNYLTNQLGAPWAIEFWMQAPLSGQTSQQDSYLLNFGPSQQGIGGNRPAVLYDYVGGAQPRDGLEMFASGTRTGAGPVVSDQNWHYVMFVYYGDGTVGVADRMDIYLDGTNAVPNVQNTFDSAISLASQFVVGTSAPEYAPFDGFTGNLDEIALYDLSDLTNEDDVTASVTSMAARHFAAALGSPPLSIALSNGQLVISWGASVSGAVLQSTPSLLPVSWTSVSTLPTVVGGREQVTLAPGGVNQFYRLALP